MLARAHDPSPHPAKRCGLSLRTATAFQSHPCLFSAARDSSLTSAICHIRSNGTCRAGRGRPASALQRRNSAGARMRNLVRCGAVRLLTPGPVRLTGLPCGTALDAARGGGSVDQAGGGQALSRRRRTTRRDSGRWRGRQVRVDGRLPAGPCPGPTGSARLVVSVVAAPRPMHHVDALLQNRVSWFRHRINQFRVGKRSAWSVSRAMVSIKLLC